MGKSAGWEVWGSLSCCPKNLGHLSAPWWPWESGAWHPCCSIPACHASGKVLGPWEGAERFLLSLLVSLFSGWNKLPPPSKMVADVLKRKPPVKRCVMLWEEMGAVCQDNPREGGLDDSRGRDLLRTPKFTFITCHSEVGKCSCGSFMEQDTTSSSGAVYDKTRACSSPSLYSHLLFSLPFSLLLWRSPSARPPSHVLVPSTSRWRFGFLQTEGAISWLLPPKPGHGDRWVQDQAPSRSPRGAGQCGWGTVCGSFWQVRVGIPQVPV